MKSEQNKTGTRRTRPVKALIGSVLAIAAISAGSAGAHLAQGPSPEAQASAQSSRAGQTMKPKAIKQFLFRRAASYNDNNDMRPTRLILTQDKLDMKGRCNPKNPYNPLFKIWKNAPKGTLNIACGETKKFFSPFNPPIYDGYIKVVDNLGGKLARIAGVADIRRGKPTSIVATNRFTKLKFDNTGGPVRAILFRTKGKPRIFPRAGNP
jgi:hypothetical protein